MHGLTSFLKLLCIPLLMAQFSQSKNGRLVLIGFLTSSTLLLAVSWFIFFQPELAAPLKPRFPGVPVKDYIAQSAIFTVCIFVFAGLALDELRRGRRLLGVICASTSIIFMMNILYIAASRTFLLAIPVLSAILAYRAFGWKGLTSVGFGAALIVLAAWPTASFFRERAQSLLVELETYSPNGQPTSAGERLIFWSRSLDFIRSAPVLGHGTGSIRELFRRAAEGQSGVAAEATANPHNQVFAVGIQLGAVGVVVLICMWAAHLALFRSTEQAAWIGSIVVLQNIIGSMFNSHLFDFLHGWLYVVGVGVAGGLILQSRCPAASLQMKIPGSTPAQPSGSQVESASAD
jgi:hypothetical protein